MAYATAMAEHELTAQRGLLSLLATLLVNTLIAAFLTAIGVGHDFVGNLLTSQCIGLCICSGSLVVWRLVGSGRRRSIALVAALPLEVAGGVALSLRFTAVDEAALWPVFGQALLIGLLFGGVIITLSLLRLRLTNLEGELHVQELRRLELDRQRVQAQLRMLQAQIEPHFLFNTLANVSGLIAAQPAQAKLLLDQLIVYLRATLNRVRAEDATLAEEVALLKAYLEVQRIRMGGRLSFAFDIPSALLAQPFPTMLLQPLVENAVKHGIETKPGAGSIRVAAAQDDSGWHIEVVDDGRGLSADSGLAGLGLVNVRERLQALHGKAASLSIAENPTGGVCARIALPFTS